MKIIVPMAGIGSRLRPHTLTIPKPLTVIAGKPIVQRLVEDITAVVAQEIDEIALNPSCFLDSDLKTILSTFVHEMCHLFQYHFGTPAKNGYHNQEWANKMEEVGLIASHTGMVGGNKTGYKMTHYVLEKGKYEKSFEKLEKLGGKMTWIESIGSAKKIYPKKTKYVCGKCNMKLWGKGGLNISCGDCNEVLEEEF